MASHLDTGMPEGDELDRQLAGRNRTARIWLAFFQFALIIAIVALVALLYKIVNDSFGLVAVENQIDPSQIVLEVERNRLQSAPNTVSVADGAELAAGVAANPLAAGFVSNTYFQSQAAGLKRLAIDGQTPDAASVASGEYPLSRPLYVYLDSRTLPKRPELAAFASFFVDHAGEAATQMGYFPVSEEERAQSRAALESAAPGSTGAGAASVPTGETITIAGSSTLAPLAQEMLDGFKTEGFAGESELTGSGTLDGLERFCNRDADILTASRALTRQEMAACQDQGVNPVALHVANDAIAVITSAQNDFADALSMDQVRTLFTGAEKWSDVNPAWPAETIERHIPDENSGTLDFFAEAVSNDTLESLGVEDLAAVLEQNLSRGIYRKLMREKPLVDRTQSELLALLNERVVVPSIVASWSATDSLLNRKAIEEQMLAEHPTALISWRSWLNLNFLTQPQSSVPEQAGIRTAILGSLWVVLITIVFAVPVGIGTAVYLEEYAGHGKLQRIIQTNIDNLAGVPSIIYGILGLSLFVRVLEPFTSGAIFGASDPTTANGRTVIAAGLTLMLLVLPVVIINAQEAIRAVPRSLREAGYGLGATKWQVTWSHVLSNALPGIFTGTILAISRAIGETAPLIVVGASTFITQDPTGPFSKFTVLPMQIYQWTSRPQPEFKHIAAAASLVLLAMLLLINGTAIVLRNKYSKQL